MKKLIKFAVLAAGVTAFCTACPNSTDPVRKGYEILTNKIYETVKVVYDAEEVVFESTQYMKIASEQVAKKCDQGPYYSPSVNYNAYKACGGCFDCVIYNCLCSHKNETGGVSRFSYYALYSLSTKAFALHEGESVYRAVLPYTNADFITFDYIS